MIGKLHAVVLECPEPQALAEFYRSVLGGEVEPDPDGDWLDLVVGTLAPTVSFQRVSGYVPPEWPGSTGEQQLHLDIRVPDLDVADRELRGIGARFVQDQGSFRVYLDPVGHPFCTVL